MLGVALAETAATPPLKSFFPVLNEAHVKALL
jgi:hypothetical protein